MAFRQYAVSVLLLLCAASSSAAQRVLLGQPCWAIQIESHVSVMLAHSMVLAAFSAWHANCCAALCAAVCCSTTQFLACTAPLAAA